MPEEITTPEQLIKVMYAEILHLRFVTQCLVRKLEPGKVARLQPFDLLEADLLAGYMKRVEIAIEGIDDPIWKLLMGNVMEEPEENEERAEPVTEEIALVECEVDEALDLRENITFYSDKTVDLSKFK